MTFTQHRTIRRARGLRRKQTEAERRLRGFLRDRRLGGFKFLRQAPIGPFFVDFLCRDRMLAVELDGATHGTDEELAYDERRTAFLQTQGHRVHRVWNIDGFNNLDDVLNSIRLELEAGAETGR